MPTHITTLIYAQRGDRVALLRRSKEPNLGLWSPPGGKIEPGETPLDNALRELNEETGLTAADARLAAVVSEIDASSGEQWLMFVFHCAEPVGSLDRATHEGQPRWVPLADLPGLECPPADPHIAGAVLSGLGGVAFINVGLEGGKLTGVTVTREKVV